MLAAVRSPADFWFELTKASAVPATRFLACRADRVYAEALRTAVDCFVWREWVACAEKVCANASPIAPLADAAIIDVHDPSWIVIGH